MSNSNLRDEVDDLKERVSTLEKRLEGGEGTPEDFVGLREFVNKTNPSTHNERALVIGYHFDRQQGKESFSSDDIEGGYRTAREPLPANISDVLSKCENKGWLMRDGKEGQAQLRVVTSDGLKYVEEMFEDES
ncbi:hypothetical protein NKF26_12005 [Haladaptatus sp. AB618]|uniref:hypothetical protein n=1 Tax=Haladaptatus sp. AB618 TaxID=2934173 RepID=UPI00209C62C4|nr:hypothetical protein [Haladaptatus sp. AB618]MCO8254526.1 hypothetical protein [Haladaptatus sp. AB618]